MSANQNQDITPKDSFKEENPDYREFTIGPIPPCKTGFNSFNGVAAVALTALLVTHYNFLHPHQSLNYNVPVPIDELRSLENIQTKWIKILSMLLFKC